MKLLGLSFLLFLHFVFDTCDGAKLLVVLPIPIRSHHLIFKPIINEIVNRGHEVTVITASPEDNPKYKQIPITNILDDVVDSSFVLELRKITRYQNNWFMSFFGETVVEHFLQSPQVQQIIHSQDLHFDVVLVESMFYQEAVIAFGHKFQAPVIELQSLSASSWLNTLINNPYSFSYFVDFWTPYSDRMSFLQRLENTVFGVVQILSKRLFFLPRQQALADKYLNYTGWETRPSLDELFSDVALVILDTHLALHYAHPNNPNVIEVAGLHLKPPQKLPKELQDYLDNAKEGVIYFSLGSNIKSKFMPEEIKQNFITAFGKLPYKVLWKWEEETLDNKPENVKISKWLPQSDILAHPNIKAFITHGGFLSLTEAVYNGVPIITIPFYGDQWKNSKQAETAGYGITLYFDDVTVDSVVNIVNKIITEPSYKESAKKQSKILRDNPFSAIDTVLYWIEYVIRHKGASHLRSAAKDLTWYQYFLLDVIAAMVVAVITGLIIIYLCLKAVLNRLCKRKTVKNPVVKKKKKN